VNALAAGDQAGDRLLSDLRQALRNGTLAAGTRVAPLRELAERYGLHASRAQRVIRRLAREGLLVCRRGDGTFVAEAATGTPESARPQIPAESVTVVLPPFAFGHDGRSGSADGTVVGTDFVRGIEDVLGSGPAAYRIIRGSDDLPPDALAHKGGGRRCLIGFQGGPPRMMTAARSATGDGTQVILAETDDQHADWALCLRVDAARGIGLAVSHLAELGHRRLLFVGWAEARTAATTFWWVHEREAACRTAAAAAGVEVAVAAIGGAFSQPQADADWAALLDAQFRRAGRPTALICANDILAEAALRHCERHGLRLPTDLSVTGFDDSGAALVQGLTTVHRHFREQGRLAALTARQFIAGGAPLHGRLALTPTLIIRRTTGPAPAAKLPVAPDRRVSRAAKQRATA